MRAIACALLAMLVLHYARNISSKMKYRDFMAGLLLIESWLFATLAIVFMILGI